ncbi:MAG: prolyl oligopeptidase family serine peptidase [Acidimicrobiia bacterium]
MSEPTVWVGKQQRHGVASEPRKDLLPPPHWRMEAVASTFRPRHPVVSPDGTQVLFLVDSDMSDVWRVAVAGGRPERLTTHRQPAPFWEDTAATWSPDGTRFAYVADGTVHVAAAAGSPPHPLVEGDSPQWIDRTRLLITVNRNGRTRLAVIDIADPWPHPLTGGDGHAAAASLTADRSKAAYAFYPAADRRRSDIRMVDLTTGEDRHLSGEPGFADASPAIRPDGSLVAFVSERSGWSEVHLVGADGAGERRLTDHRADLSGLAWSGDGSRLAGIATRAGKADLVTIDPETGAVTVVAQGGTWSSPSWTGDDRLVAGHESHHAPSTIAAVTGGGAVTTLVDPTPAQVRSAPHVTPEPVTFRSGDGLDIPAFLFRPPAADRGPVPAVVYPHGGPTSYYGDEWDGYAQYFLDKGYAWLAINFRGSTSYGLDFERANHGDWGVGDRDDCLAAHDYLAGLDWIDRRRIGIFGASYGSYLALLCLVDDPEHRYACGVAKYGDSDILNSWAMGDVTGVEDLERMMGHPGDDPDAYLAGSPLARLEAIERPILIAHGELDDRVHPRQSEQLVERLEELGKTYEYVTYPTEGHGLLRRQPQLDFYRRLERFLDWHLMGSTAVTGVGLPPLGAG